MKFIYMVQLDWSTTDSDGTGTGGQEHYDHAHNQ